jgi:hypothetical protein
MNRRTFFLSLSLTLWLGSTATSFADDDGGSDDGGGGGGTGGSGNGGSGGSGGSNGSGNSGRSGGDDNDDDNSAQGNQNNRKRRDSDDVARAVNDGLAVSLKKLKSHLNANYPGKILKVEFKKLEGAFVYRVKILQANNKVTSLALDAKTLVKRR